MTIRIIEEPEIKLTRSEYDRLMREYEEANMFRVNPPPFEEWLRGRSCSWLTKN